MSIMAAGMGHTRIFRLIGQPSLFSHRQRIHIASEEYGLSGTAASEHADDPCSRATADNQPQLGEVIFHNTGSPVLLKAQFWVAVKIPPQSN